MSPQVALLATLWCLTIILAVVIRRLRIHEQIITPWQYFHGAAAWWTVLSIVLAIAVDVVFALKLAVGGVGTLALVTWASTWQRHKFRDWILNILSIGLIVGWLLFKAGVAGFPEALARMGAMLLLVVLVGVLSRRLMPKIRRTDQ